jgi:hypothetical protein
LLLLASLVSLLALMFVSGGVVPLMVDFICVYVTAVLRVCIASSSAVSLV